MAQQRRHAALGVDRPLAGRRRAVAEDALDSLERVVLSAQLGQQLRGRLAHRAQAAAEEQLGIEALPHRPEARPVQRLGGRGLARRVLDRPAHERVHQRHEARSLLEAGLHVELAQLDRAEPRL